MPIVQQRGFSLLEILIAFTIMAFSLSILLKIFSSGVTTAMMAEDYSLASQIAQTQLARAGFEIPLQNGTHNGEANDGKYQWQVTIEPFTFINGKAVPDATVQLFKVIVSVVWDKEEDNDDGGRQVVLTTLRLANKPQ